MFILRKFDFQNFLNLFDWHVSHMHGDSMKLQQPQTKADNAFRQNLEQLTL